MCLQCIICFQCFYSNVSNESLLPLNSLKRIYGSILHQHYSQISRIYLFADTNFNFSVNTIMLNATIIKYLAETVIFEDSFNSLDKINSSYVDYKESYKATWTVDLVHLSWTCIEKYLFGGAAFSASLISSVSSLDQCKSILHIRKWNYALHLQSFKAT